MTMPHRAFVSMSVMALTIAVGVPATVSIAAQELTYTAPRTPDGQPDLQGFWTNQTYTPLERPDGVTGEFYTAEEVAEIETRVRNAKPRRPRPAPFRTFTTISRSSGWTPASLASPRTCEHR